MLLPDLNPRMRTFTVPARLLLPCYSSGLASSRRRLCAGNALQLQLAAMDPCYVSKGMPQGVHACTASRAPLTSRPLQGKKRGELCKASCVATLAAASGSGSLVSSVAVAVGWLVIIGSCVRSLPQILRILNSKSVEGLSLTSFSAEVLVCAIQLAYNITYRYPFSTFGEVLSCELQNLIVIGLIFFYGSISRGTQIGLVLGFAGLCSYLFSGACSLTVLNALQASTVVILAVFGRVPQILMNIKRGNSGELSAATVGLSLAGNLARVFTTLTLVRDPRVLAGAAVQGLLNAIILWQTIDTAFKLKARMRAQPEFQ